MNSQDLEQAIQSDLYTLRTLKMGTVSARDFYGSVWGVIFKLSLILLSVNTLIRLALKGAGLYDPEITMNLMLGTWFGCLIVSCFIGFTVSRLLLIAKLSKGRLKTASLIKQKIRHFSLIYFGIYAVIYTVCTALLNSCIGFNDHITDFWLVVFCAVMAQAFSFLISIVATGLFAGVELDRLGLGALFNVIADVVSKAKNQARQTNSTKDA